MDEQKRKKISIIGSFLFHIFIFLFISITGLLKFTTLPQYDEIVEITSVSGSGGGSASANITDSTYTPPLEPAPVEQAPITPDSILQHSDIATTNVTYEQIQELQEKVEKHEISTEEAVIAPPINNNVEHSNHHNGNNATINTNDDTGSSNGTGTDSGSSEGTGDGESSGSGSGSGVGDSDGNDDNDDNVYSNPAIPPRIIKSPTPKYPIKERNNKIEGVSIVRFLIGKDGSIESAEIISSSGSSALDEAALNTAYKWQFLPAKNTNGQDVRCYATQPFTFQLK